MIVGIIPIYFRSTDSVLFDPRSTFFYMSTYFSFSSNFISEPLVMPSYVSTLVGDSLKLDRVYRSCIVTFHGCETLVDLFILNMVDFNVIFLRIDCLLTIMSYIVML